MRSSAVFKGFKPAPDALESGQGTVEFAIVTAGLIALIVGLGAIAHTWDSGLVVSHALRSASHMVSAASGWIADVFCY